MSSNDLLRHLLELCLLWKQKNHVSSVVSFHRLTMSPRRSCTCRDHVI